MGLNYAGNNQCSNPESCHLCLHLNLRLEDIDTPGFIKQHCLYYIMLSL